MANTKHVKVRNALKNRKTNKSTSDVVEIAAVVDRSGSMGSVKSDAIGGFNEFLNGQQALDGKAVFTHAQFDDMYELLCNGVDIHDAKPYTKDTYQPRGMTALLDAVGKTINDISARHAKMAPALRPKKVLVAILTDGQENSSREFTKDKLKTLMDAKNTEGWEFVFIAAGFDQFTAESMATSYGFAAGSACGIDADRLDGIHASYMCMTSAATNYRNTGSTGNWKDNSSQ
jgi:hypothetical protein